MLGVLILVIGLMPLVIGAYALKVLRSSDEPGPDDPPPPPEPERPLPVVPPSQKRRDRDPIQGRRHVLTWRARRTAR